MKTSKIFFLFFAWNLKPFLIGITLCMLNIQVQIRSLGCLVRLTILEKLSPHGFGYNPLGHFNLQATYRLIHQFCRGDSIRWKLDSMVIRYVQYHIHFSTSAWLVGRLVCRIKCCHKFPFGLIGVSLSLSIKIFKYYEVLGLWPIQGSWDLVVNRTKPSRTEAFPLAVVVASWPNLRQT